MDLRDQILSSPDIASEIVEVPHWNVKLEVRALDGKSRAKMLTQYANEDGTMNLERLYPALLIQSCFDPETGEKVFEDSDTDALNAKSGAALEQVAQVAIRLSAMTPEAVEEAGKDSSVTPKDGSTSSLQSA